MSAPSIRRAIRGGFVAAAALTLVTAMAMPAQAATPLQTVHVGVTAFGCARSVTHQHVGCLGLLAPRTVVRPGGGGVTANTTGSPTTVGLTPAKLISAYNLAGTNGGGRTVAI